LAADCARLTCFRRLQNRICILISNPVNRWRLKWGVAGLIFLVNCSVYALWLPARLQICEASCSIVGVQRASTDARALDHSRALHQTECVSEGLLRATHASSSMLTPIVPSSDQVWDRCEKVIYLLVDAALNYLFVRMVSTRLVDLGLTKVRPRHRSREVSGRSKLMHPPSPCSTTRCSSSTSGSASRSPSLLKTLSDC
jgi:hypothetical protein